MKTLITMMNAMKHYDHHELLREDSGIQEKLSQDISAPAYRKMIEKIHAKHFRIINRK